MDPENAVDWVNRFGFFIQDGKLSFDLKIKRRENEERRERDQLLKKLSPGWVCKIEKVEFVYSSWFFERFPVPPGQDFKEGRFIRSLNFRHMLMMILTISFM
jgi:hypothetical protein